MSYSIEKENERIEELCERVINDLKVRREKLGITVAKLAEMTNMHQSNLTRMETGGAKQKVNRPTLRTLITVANALGADIKIVPRKN